MQRTNHLTSERFQNTCQASNANLIAPTIEMQMPPSKESNKFKFSGLLPHCNTNAAEFPNTCHKAHALTVICLQLYTLEIERASPL